MWKQRVVAELEELNVKITKLGDFMVTEPFRDLMPRKQDLMRSQRLVMCQYADLLSQRLYADRPER